MAIRPHIMQHPRIQACPHTNAPCFNFGSIEWSIRPLRPRIKHYMVLHRRSDPNTSSHVHTMIWCTLATTLETSPLTSTQKNLQRRQKTMVIVACSQCWNGAILAISFLTMLMIMMMKTTWSLKEKLLFKWMKLAFMAIQNHFSLLQKIVILTIQCWFILHHKRCPGTSDDNMFHGRLAIDRVRAEKQGRRPTSENHSHNSKKNKMMITGMIHRMLHVLRHRQLLHSCDHDIAECKRLPIEDNTAEIQFYCIVF